MELSSISFTKTNFDILNSYQTELEEPPKHLFGVMQKYTSLFLVKCSKIRSRQTIKIKTFSRNSKCHFGLGCKVMNATFSHSDCQCSATYPLMNSIIPLTNQVLLFAGVTNIANMGQWEAVVTVSLFFSLFTPTPLTPLPPPTGILYSRQFCSYLETKMTAH